MELHGQHIIGSKTSAQRADAFKAVNPALGIEIEPAFARVSDSEINQAMNAAQSAFETYRRTTGEQRAAFLERIAEQIESLGDEMLDRFVEETGLPRGRAEGERARTCGQLRLFAKVASEGSWADARIDTAIPDRQPLPKPDLRRILIPLGPIVVFSASNFPLAFSVAGGDTASAFAAGCPVVVKCHWGHPGVSEMVGRAVQQAAEATGMPDGVFSMLQGRGHEIGTALAKHPLTRAIGFTGSLTGGRALFDAASSRPDPIPVYAEMGSINPVFVLPGAAAERGEQIAAGLVQSVTLGVGQFCTNPGLVIGLDGDDVNGLIDKTAELIGEHAPASMLYAGLCEAYGEGLQQLEASQAEVVGMSSQAADTTLTEGAPAVLRAEGAAFLANEELHHEVFGPSTLFVVAGETAQLNQIARRLEGQLTATIHGTEDDLKEHAELVAILEDRVGRLIFNSFPTGVEVCPSMNHGGPYPASSDSHFTSVGTAAIFRFARPIAYQGFPQDALPTELRDRNEAGVWRMVNGEMSRDDV